MSESFAKPKRFRCQGSLRLIYPVQIRKEETEVDRGFVDHQWKLKSNLERKFLKALVELVPSLYSLWWTIPISYHIVRIENTCAFKRPRVHREKCPCWSYTRSRVRTDACLDNTRNAQYACYTWIVYLTPSLLNPRTCVIKSLQLPVDNATFITI